MTLETLNNSVDGIPSEVKDYQADDLSQRLNFLQSFGLFKVSLSSEKREFVD